MCEKLSLANQGKYQIMSRLKISSCNSLRTQSTGQTASMKAAVYLQTSVIPNDPLAVEQWYLGDTNKRYQNHSCLRNILLSRRPK